MTAPDRDTMLGLQLIYHAYELVPRIDLKQLRSPEGAQFVNPFKSTRNLFGLFCGQGLGHFVVGGHVNNCERILEHFAAMRQAVIWQKQEIGLVDFIQCHHIKLGLRYVSGNWQVDLPDGLLLKPSIRHPPQKPWLLQRGS